MHKRMSSRCSNKRGGCWSNYNPIVALCNRICVTTYPLLINTSEKHPLVIDTLLFSKQEQTPDLYRQLQFE